MGTKSDQTRKTQPSLAVPAVYCLIIIGLGLWVSLATGEWIAMVCAAGLLVLPVRGYSNRRSKESK
ncbi:hypothetical protein MUG94_01250 [Arthrobacter gengyunqii]|uniref:Uncharacterized protein n=1 Tax=Arthrobacter gengyunqii TaxID=2886940 RepID=A0A9X1M4N4_9MICC|nr:hypothetical protein [Arthrobacter gengyunqii]MCC3270857.1 hypothetical protein [Arthrobacter gengyunqii]UOY96452.1 hypothetical protein MUG94_01250 [Arthrobacter gengyunqii]